jgi:Family of unknown function (DUF6282)
MDRQLKGVLDLHVHTAPDLVPRCVDDLQMARRAQEAGMAGFVIKSHHAPTAGRAALCNTLLADVRVIGSITLNHYVGGLNACAVEAAAQSGARVVWLPTTDAANEAGILASWPTRKPLPPYLRLKQDLLDRGRLPPAIAVTGDDGRLTRGAKEVIEVVSDYGLMLCTGHLGWPEMRILVPATRRAGVDKIVITHPESPSIGLSLEQQSWLADQGAFFERCYAYSASGRVIDQEARAVRLTGVARNVLSSDLGMVGGPLPDTGLAQFIREFHQRGFSEQELSQMTVRTPRALVEE